MNVIKSRFQNILPAVLLLAGVAYFGYHLMNGNYGLMALGDLDKEYATLKVMADQAAEERHALEVKVAGLRPDNLDPDLLDERARKILGFSKRDEFIILK